MRKLDKFKTGGLILISLLLNGGYVSHAATSEFEVNMIQQTLNVSGKVVDENGSPMAGVLVQVEGTTKGAITDTQGAYEIKGIAQGTKLVFSFVGYQTKTESANSDELHVQMEVDALVVEDVVVVGYGQQKKVSVTGAVASITDDALKSSPSANLEGALAGKLPGLSLMQASGTPGNEDFEIRLRGASTLSDSGQEPLILVDGVPRDNLNMLDVNEIASISILKDASATAVFGVRGANGVILVTTKTGTTDKPSLNASVEFGLQSFASDFASINSWEKITLDNQAKVNDGIAVSENAYRRIDLYKADNNPMYPNTNWNEIFFKSVAPLSRYNVNLSGKTNKTKYFVNIGMVDQKGMVQTLDPDDLGYDPQYKMNRVNLRGNIDVDINDWITASTKLSSYIQSVGKPGVTSVNEFTFIRGIYGVPATTPVVAEPDWGVPDDAIFNDQYGNLNYSGYVDTNTNVFNSSFSFDFDLGEKITKGLTAKLMASYDATAGSVITASTDYNLYSYGFEELTDESGNLYDVVSITAPTEPQVYRLSVSKSYSYKYALNLQAMLNYNREFGKHTVGAMFVHQRDNNSSTGSGVELLPHNYVGYAARATYNYDDRFLAEFNVGYNGSEQFAEDRRFAFFPAGSIGWVVTKEKFMENVKFVDNLKVRASYGKVGNDQIGDDRFLYMDKNTISSGGTTTAGLSQYVSEGLIGNPLLTWEVAYKQNYGIDLSILNKSISFTFDYFRENREQILITQNSVSTILGYYTSVAPKANLGQVKNKGFEVELGYRKQLSRDFSFRVNANASFARNLVIYRDEVPNSEDYLYQYTQEGFSMGTIFGYNIDWDSPGNGYFLSQAEIDEYAEYTGTDPRVGDFVYKDLNEDGYIDARDYAPLGDPSLPELNYSFNLSFNFKNIDFTALFTGTGDSYLSYFNSSSGILEAYGYQTHHLTAWTLERHEAGLPITYPALSSTDVSSSFANNDFFVQNRRYFRFKNLEIGYTLPKKVTDKLRMSKLRIYSNATNLFTWDGVTFDLVDPEQSGNNTVLPLTRVINFGANIVF
ncbi:MAG: TonB-dependent receptor [Rikenellaceae bacterium]